MKRTLILIFACIALSVQAQDNTRSLRFGYVNFDSVLTSMPDYTLCQKQMADLRAKYDAEQKRAEDEFIFDTPDSAADKPDDTPNRAKGSGKMIDDNPEQQWNDEYWESDYDDENKDFQVVSDPDDA